MKLIKILVSFIILIFLFLSLVFAKQLETKSDSNLAPRVIAEKLDNIQVSSEASISRVILKFKDSLEVRLRSDKIISQKGISVKTANNILKPFMNQSLRRLFRQQDEKKLKKNKEILQYRSQSELADLNSYYAIETQSLQEAITIIEQLNSLESIEIAYVEPTPVPAVDIAPPTSNFVDSQLYLTQAPAGIDALYAHTLPGGDGAGIRIIDIEGNWQTTHEDLESVNSGFIIGDVIAGEDWIDHGTAVIGVLVGTDNEYGITGISPSAELGMIAVGSMSVAEAIYIAIDSLDVGDVILIEVQAPGPLHDFAFRQDQEGYICMEYWQANYDAIKYAWAKGIVVVEAAGNGSDNLDNIAVYGELFDTLYRNSHAIIVGAGYPASSPNDLEREPYSNYGERINLQGYGSEVYTTGYGDLFDGNGDPDQYYTSGFGGTSAAAPIIAGAVASVQGYMKAQFGTVLTSDYIRDLFYKTGTSQLGNTLEHIGPRLNLDSAINSISAPPSLMASPFYIDTIISEGESFIVDMWLYNSSLTENTSYYIYDRDSSARVAVTNWLEVSSQTGTVYANDSSYLGVTLDATSLTQRSSKFQGVLEIIWGPGAASFDSYLLVPVYLEIPCNDSSFTTISSDDIGGPTYDWISAKDSGIKIDNASYYNPGKALIYDDGSSGPFAIGFDFPFYTNYYDSFYVGINGALSFTDPNINIDGNFETLFIPGLPFSSFLAPFWNDLYLDDELVPDAGVYVYQNLTADTTVIEWYRFANFNVEEDTLITFEIILSSDGNIKYQYKSLGVEGLENLAMIGISEIDCSSFGHVNASDSLALVPHSFEAILFQNHLYFGKTGNINGLDDIDIGDLIWLINYMFAGGPSPVPLDAADFNCSGSVDISDLIALVNYMFSGGDEPCEKWLHDGNN